MSSAPPTPAISRRYTGVSAAMSVLRDWNQWSACVKITVVIPRQEHNCCYGIMSMMPSTDTSLSARNRLVAAALAVLERDGPAAIQARTLAGEIGASTMAVYTHFGGMPKVIEAVMREGLARFAEHTRGVPQTEDPMADLIAGGLAYGEFAMQNPQLYRLLFGLSDLAAVHKLSGDGATPWHLAEGVDALSVLVSAVERVIEAGRIRPQEPTPAATQILSATHGFVLLAMTGFIDSQGLQDVMAPLAINLMVGLGDTRRRAKRSLAAAITARASLGYQRCPYLASQHGDSARGRFGQRGEIGCGCA
ncbi:TetR/AcrR family transcriptional regulator [Candidatus Mycobacterium methanotrophicum]|nr:TetR/AcrR family transcriptional regulator [Candidatus Mycobacterium methanotrophicum]